MDIAARVVAEEQMDAEDLDPAVYAAVIGDLARANRLTMNARPTLAFLDRTVRGRPFRLLDVGFGHGDMLRSIFRWSVQQNVECELVGVDLNPRSAPVATAATPPGLPIRYVTGDYEDLAAEPWDVIVSSLVAHHMSDAQLVAFLRFMDRHARMGWLVNDLHRHRLALVGYPILATLMRWHPMVKADGTLSIARSFRRDDWRTLLAAAGVEARIYRSFPFRLCVAKSC
jgi:2-polyprenyl-3-methyl-5-hydroxy-6-metoxy-1,4-benzoquinol methylase